MLMDEKLEKKDRKHLLKDGRLAEVIRYVFFGVGTTVVNIAIYQSLLPFMDYRVSNLIAILAAKIFAYVTNKLFVFRSKCGSLKELLLEMLRFILARGATGVFDYFGLMFAVDVLRQDRVWSKYVIQIIVIAMNYILGKKAVFVGKGKKEQNRT